MLPVPEESRRLCWEERRGSVCVEGALCTSGGVHGAGSQGPGVGEASRANLGLGRGPHQAAHLCRPSDLAKEPGRGGLDPSTEGKCGG